MCKQTFLRIMDMRNELEDKMVTFGRRAENAQRLLVLLYSNPATGKAIAEFLEVTNARAANF